MEGHRRALATVRARVKYILVVGAAAAVVVAGALTSGPAHAQTSSRTRAPPRQQPGRTS